MDTNNARRSEFVESLVKGRLEAHSASLTPEYQAAQEARANLESTFWAKLPDTLRKEYVALSEAVGSQIAATANMCYKHGFADGLELAGAFKKPPQEHPRLAPDVSPTLTVVEVAKLMKCSRAKVYDIMRRPDFPKVKDGRKIFIPREGFLDWYRRVGQV